MLSWSEVGKNKFSRHWKALKLYLYVNVVDNIEIILDQVHIPIICAYMNNIIIIICTTANKFLKYKSIV